jgi:hypothetical protein
MSSLPAHADYTIVDNTYSRSVSRRGTRVTIEVGDRANRTGFTPQLDTVLFSGHCRYSVRYLSQGVATNLVVDGKIVYDYANQALEFYETVDGYEVSLVLKSPPATNELRFQLETENVAFHYQKDYDLMTQAEKDSLPDGIYQPERIKGSYAVYATSAPRGVPSREFTTGKVGHIYRVWAEDANATRVWCDMDIDRAGILTVTLPQSFLDSATYPVLVDPEIGYIDIGGTESTVGSKALCDNTASRHYTASDNEQIETFSFYARMTGGSADIEVGVYDLGTGSTPDGSTLNSSADCAISSTSASWATSGPVNSALVSGNNYAIAFGNNRTSGGVLKGYLDALGGSQMAETTNTAALEPTFNNDDGFVSYILSAYATVGASSSASTGGGLTNSVLLNRRRLIG